MTIPSEVKTKELPHKPRRDFLILAASAIGTVGTACFMWPFVDSFNPSADVLAFSSIDVDLKPIQVGQAITVMWQGKPVFIRRRTPEEIAQVSEVELKTLLDPESDKKRTLNPQWIVVVGICTHLGCVPLGQKPTDDRGTYGGWFCPCHGSLYDVSGRVRKGPAPSNLVVPPYMFVNENTIRIGEKAKEAA